MFAMLRRFLAYRRLKPIVTALPAHLAQAFGRGEIYTLPQVKRALAGLKLDRRAVPYALAAACSLEELDKSGGGLTAERYRLLRQELAELFDLPSGFTMAHLARTRYSQHDPAGENAYASGGPPDSHG